MATVVPAFRTTLSQLDLAYLKPDRIQTLQVNVGDLCNQACTHCHVNASPKGKDNMEGPVFEQILSFLSKGSIEVLDITGGAPEMNPHFKKFVEHARCYVERVIIRTNLTVYFEPGMDWVPEWFKKQNLTLVASLPCYTEETVDKQRGRNVFQRSIKALQWLNDLGYGKELELNLVYNPAGDFLPSDQKDLEDRYKKELAKRFNIQFTQLFALANLPVGRFRDFLKRSDKLNPYLKLLYNNFNPNAVSGIMCRNLISVDWQGRLYHCDFNQQEGLPIRTSDGDVSTIQDIDQVIQDRGDIVMRDYCYGCTAGAGSSCSGSLV